MVEITVDDKVEYFYTVSEVSKIIQLPKIGRNKFMKLLRQEGYLLDNNFPRQSLIDMGMARVYGVNKNFKTYYIPIFSERGVNYLKNKLYSPKEGNIK